MVDRNEREPLGILPTTLSLKLSTVDEEEEEEQIRKEQTCNVMLEDKLVSNREKGP